MQKDEGHLDESDRKVAAVCGLYCGACSWLIATREDPERLKRLAAQFQYSEEECRCYGCRSGKRLPYCEKCKMFACAAERGIDFCSQCEEYPCDDLKRFQAAMPHRIELWVNLERVKAVGHKQWLEEMKKNFSCPRCGTINSTYDLTCRRCGEEPSCDYVGRHGRAIEQYLKSR
jgi:hypothetical protein